MTNDNDIDDNEDLLTDNDICRKMSIDNDDLGKMRLSGMGPCSFIFEGEIVTRMDDFASWFEWFQSEVRR